MAENNLQSNKPQSKAWFIVLTILYATLLIILFQFFYTSTPTEGIVLITILVSLILAFATNWFVSIIKRRKSK